MFVDNAAIVLRRARMASTGVMVFRRLLEPALSLLRDSGGMVTMVTVIRVVRAGHGQHHTVSVPASRRAPGGQLITQSSHFNAASPSLCADSQSSLITPLVRSSTRGGRYSTDIRESNLVWERRPALTRQIHLQIIPVDLRLTCDWPETDLKSSWRIWCQKMKNKSSRQVRTGRTDERTNIVTPWAPWRSQKLLPDAHFVVLIPTERHVNVKPLW